MDLVLLLRFLPSRGFNIQHFLRAPLFGGEAFRKVHEDNVPKPQLAEDVKPPMNQLKSLSIIQNSGDVIGALAGPSP